jgi:uncharacterized membrane protein
MTETTSDVRSYRLSNIDMMRGLVIVIMAIDHFRDYFFQGAAGLDLGDPAIDPMLYFTRWITHFCAPVFVFLAGTSVGFMSARRSSKDLAKFVFKRGLWLIFCEIFIISTAVTFTPFGEPAMNGATIACMQVLWALGISMIVLSGALFLGARNCMMIGAAILIGHNLLDPSWPTGDAFGAGTDPVWVSLHSMSSFTLPPFHMMMVYPPIPWIGVILLGFGTTFIFQKEPVERDVLLRKIGLSFFAAFVIIRFSNIYGDPDPWQVQELGVLSTFLDFMNVTKYPASLLYLLATLGPMAILCSYADRMQGWFKDTLVMFGRVPFAFYVVHFYLIHLLSVLFGTWQGFEAEQMMHMYPFYPEGYGTGLLGVYVWWVLVLLILYPFCKWVAGVKSRRKDWWLSYL